MGWRRAAYRAVRPLLFLTDAEWIHLVTLATLARVARTAPGRAACRLASGAPARLGAPPAEAAPVEVAGLGLRNRVGLGAGFDKDGVALEGWAALGFGFVELGTITPRPQPGNQRPRLRRLIHDEALLNRMGFNNQGAAALAERIAAVRDRLPEGFVIGVNIGPNRDTAQAGAIEDYLVAARAVAGAADYLVLNVSSPNTPGLRSLQAADRLLPLVEAVADCEPRRPLFVKLSPDTDGAELDATLEALAGAPTRGLIVSNTSVGRSGLRSPDRLTDQEGGISGRPLFEPMRAAVSHVRRQTGDRFAIVASGGIDSGSAAREAIDAGADLVQLWTGMVYAGPGLIGEAVRALA